MDMDRKTRNQLIAGVVVTVAIVTLIAGIVTPSYGVGWTMGDETVVFKNKCDYPVHVEFIWASDVQGPITIWEFDLKGYGYGGSDWITTGHYNLEGHLKYYVVVSEKGNPKNFASASIPRGIGDSYDTAQVTIGGDRPIMVWAEAR
jgi:hypothetical protein